MNEMAVETARGTRRKRIAKTKSANEFSAEALIQRKKSTWPEASAPISDLMIRLYRVRDIIYDTSRRRVKREFHLTPAEYEVIVTLRTVAPPYRLTPTQLRKSLLISPGGITKVLNNLEERNLIARGRDSGDGRSRTVKLTAKGVELAETAVQDVFDNYREQFAAGLDAEQTRELNKLLRALLKALEPSGR
jgi:DNA-binding MarR family transcriptional regulator